MRKDLLNRKAISKSSADRHQPNQFRFLGIPKSTETTHQKKNIVIDHACPVIVLDDVKQELWEISHGLSVCGLPVMPHLIINGTLEREPTNRHEGVRILFTDLHVLGPAQAKPEQYVSALVNFIQKLISPSAYLIVFWSAYPNEANTAWSLLVSRLKTQKL